MGRRSAPRAPNLNVIRGEPKPAGWSGKMWALQQGVAASSAPVLLLHRCRHRARPAAPIDAGRARLTEPRPVELVSEMVRLNCASLAERALVPAFVYFFQMLYPFARVNDPRSRVAAAAGGTVLIRREALQRIGGIEAIKDALIDDVALAKAVKAAAVPSISAIPGSPTSIRPYPHFADIWRMISRTAFTQLRYSATLLLLTLLGLTLVWLVPPGRSCSVAAGKRPAGSRPSRSPRMSYLPTLDDTGAAGSGRSALPLIALFYMAATCGSALNYWRGAGARWKNRAYGARADSAGVTPFQARRVSNRHRWRLRRRRTRRPNLPRRPGGSRKMPPRRRAMVDCAAGRRGAEQYARLHQGHERLRKAPRVRFRRRSRERGGEALECRIEVAVAAARAARARAARPRRSRVTSRTPAARPGT